jgi:hypothetical protein
MLRVLERAWEKTRPRFEMVTDDDAPGCEGDSCAV